MKNSKEAPKTQRDCELMAQEIRRSIHPIDDVTQWELHVLDEIFDESRRHPEEFQHLYVEPLLEEGVPVESAFQLLVEGVFRPN